MTVHALRNGIKTDYHTFMRRPDEIRQALARLGLDVKKFEDDDSLRIMDSFTAQTGLGVPEQPAKSQAPWATSLKLSDWSIGAAQTMKDQTVPESHKRRLHIDDNTSILNQYNEEKAFIDYWRTRMIPWARSLELVIINALVVGVYSEAFYRQFELLMDGIIDIRSLEKGQIEHYMRVRTMRGRLFDSRWHELKLKDSGEVILADQPYLA
jgi:KaiC/GvpD/RAD55 family RecA-like ATPase